MAPEPPTAEASHGHAERQSAREVLISVAHRRGAEASAHQVMASEWASAESLGQLVREHESLVSVANSERWEQAFTAAGLPADVLDTVRRSPEWDGLVGALGNAEASRAPGGAALSKLVDVLTVSADPVATLREVLRQWEGLAARRLQNPRELVAGLVPRVKGIEDEDLARAVREREAAIARRARELAEAAALSGKRWAKPFGPPPKDPAVADAWWERLAVIAAYRDQWHVAGPSILGDDAGVSSSQQALHRERARRAGREAAVLSGFVPPPAAVPSAWAGPNVQVEPELGI